MWKYKDMHYICRKELILTHTLRAPLVLGALPPNPRRGCQFLHSTRTSFLAEFENPKALIQVGMTHAKKYERIEKHARI